MKTYVFTDDQEMMRERLKIWYNILTKDGMSAEQAKHFLSELYLNCDQAYGWSRDLYNGMLEYATS